MPSDTAVWLYAVIPGGTEQLGELTGISGEPIRRIRGGDLSAVVGTVSLEEFGEAALRRNLEDLEWLAVVARAHDAVISVTARLTTVLPVQMTTLYHDDERVRALLTTRRQEFLAALQRVTGCDEYGVKAYAVPVSSEPATSGTAYLMKRRQELSAADRAPAEAEHLHQVLLGHAVDGKQKPPRAGAVLNGTYLVKRAWLTEFQDAVTALGKTGFELEITGPWPPYSFAVNP